MKSNIFQIRQKTNIVVLDKDVPVSAVAIIRGSGRFERYVTVVDINTNEKFRVPWSNLIKIKENK